MTEDLLAARAAAMEARMRETGLSRDTHVVWLDQVWPMYRKDTFAIEAAIGMMRSTNHRFRMITVFRRR